jgi:hypothetical protein
MKRFLLLVGLVLGGCTAEVLVERPAAEGTTAAAPACDGDDPATFCDDCNPCTAKANCTPCSALPEAERDIHHCTADEELPAFCTGRTGCYRVPLTTPAGQIDGCFPVAGASDLHPGSCRAGVCADDAP